MQKAGHSVTRVTKAIHFFSKDPPREEASGKGAAMPRKVILAGLLGGVVLVVWMVLVNGIFGLHASINMKQIPAESLVYETLKEHVVDPGRYVVNPQLTAEGRFPEEEPVFSVIYGGMGHEAAGGLMLVGLIVFLLAPMIGAWMLSQTSARVQSSYSRKVLFFSAIGLLFAVFGDLMSYGIGGYPAKDTLILGAKDIIVWTLVGIVVAWRIKPEGNVSSG
jgi:hypothetical protein